MSTAREVIKKLGGARVLAREMSISYKAVNRYANLNRFPAKWYPYIQSRLSKEGCSCPQKLFSFQQGKV